MRTAHQNVNRQNIGSASLFVLAKTPQNVCEQALWNGDLRHLENDVAGVSIWRTASSGML